jgi:hypothetical protein
MALGCVCMLGGWDNKTSSRPFPHLPMSVNQHCVSGRGGGDEHLEKSIISPPNLFGGKKQEAL